MCIQILRAHVNMDECPEMWMWAIASGLARIMSPATVRPHAELAMDMHVDLRVDVCVGHLHRQASAKCKAPFENQVQGTVP